MKYFALADKSAVQAYRMLRAWNCIYAKKKLIQNLRVPSPAELRDLRLNYLLTSEPAHIMLISDNTRRQSIDIRMHYINRNTTKIFYQPKCADPTLVPDYCLLPSPAFLLAQLAKSWQLESILLLALELAGTYTNCKIDNQIYSDKQPVLLSKDLNIMCEKLKTDRWPGINKLKVVAKILEEGSASPMESLLYANLALPTRLGGVGLQNLRLNHEIALSEAATKIANQARVIVDICHPQSKTVIEYDSRQHHTEVDQSQKDKRRRDALQLDGYKCVSIIPQQLSNFAVFDECSRAILRATKGRAQVRVKNFEQKHAGCFKKLAVANSWLANL